MTTGPGRSRLRRDLGSIESYAAMIGMLVGAGIFRVTSDGSALTGPSVVLGYLLLAPCVLASSVAYAVFLSTPLGRSPAGEYAFVSAVLGHGRLAFLAAWLKLISYTGALAYLALALGSYSLELAQVLGAPPPAAGLEVWIAIGALAFFLAVHLFGVRWYGRLQVAMCVVLGISIVVLVVPGLFAVRAENYRPFLPGGTRGFLAALPPLFFAFAGFESIAHAGGEVRESTARLPRVFLRGVLLTTLIFVAMSGVAFGVLPQDELSASEAPMAEVAAVYLPRWGAALVALGGVLAVATSVNATLFVPARLLVTLADEDRLPRSLGAVNARTGSPDLGLGLTFGVAVLLILSGQTLLALGIAVVALLLVYLLTSLALLAAPRYAPELLARAGTQLPAGLRTGAAVAAILFLGGLIALQLIEDVGRLAGTTLTERFRDRSLTSLELLAFWSALGALIARRQPPRA